MSNAVERFDLHARLRTRGARSISALSMDSDRDLRWRTRFPLLLVFGALGVLTSIPEMPDREGSRA